jgi:serine O-acetyltransferase
MRFTVAWEKPAIESGWWLTHAILGMQGKVLASHYRLESQLGTGLRFTEYELRNKEDCMIIDDLKFKAECYYGQTSLRHVLRVLFTDGTSAVVLYRLAKFFQRIGLGMIGWFLSEINKLLHGCVIGRGVEFRKGFVLMHPIGVIINGAVQGGEKVVIESGVVIGASHNGLPVQVPVLGNNIFIGAGAKVLGGIRVGNNVKIGANAVVVKDVSDNVTVAGIPARIISQHHSSQRLSGNQNLINQSLRNL